ncbi:conserved hypothetical protein [Vibrio chagasii]|nr:conserved hypothetical protein [Vibrio chagasii]CAH7343205.1 conserved hypothetical protein [Vibrio chagasii]CAH7343747.1 conserved hypothetical protein [Vibrio chagasii]
MNLLSRYVALANEFGSLMTDLIIEGMEKDPNLVSMNSKHFNFAVHRSNAIYTLLESGCYWDAEIIARPLIECTVRVCFVCYSPQELRNELIKEYFEDLYEINKLEQSEKAKKSRTAMPAEDRGKILLDGLVLSEYEEEQIRAKWPKKERRAMKQKWSFSEMVRLLDKWTKPQFEKDLFSAFIHSYGISSHLIHADESGIGVIIDREQREESERALMEQSHLHNLLDLTLVSSMLMTAGLSTALNIRTKQTFELVQKFNSIHAYKDPVVDQLVDKWKDMYKKLHEDC